MPIYEFKCEDCGKVTDLFRHLPTSENIIKCECGGSAHKQISGFGFPGSEKAWAGRSEVNFHVDNNRDIYKKQLRLTANKGAKPKYMTNADWNKALGRHKKEAENMAPIKLKDEHKYGMEQKPGKVYVES